VRGGKRPRCPHARACTHPCPCTMSPYVGRAGRRTERPPPPPGRADRPRWRGRSLAGGAGQARGRRGTWRLGRSTACGTRSTWGDGRVGRALGSSVRKGRGGRSGGDKEREGRGRKDICTRERWDGGEGVGVGVSGRSVHANVNELRLGFSNTTRNPEGILVWVGVCRMGTVGRGDGGGGGG
jgi:hypothetical protein